MRVIKSTFKICLVMTALVVSTTIFAASAPGPEPVIDRASIRQTAAIDLDIGTQITNEIQSLQYQLKQLQTLTDVSSFDSANKNLNSQLNQLNSILNSVKGINYQLGDIDAQFKKLFPTDTEWSKKSMDDYSNYLQQWSGELQNASSTAMQTQSVISNVQMNNQQVQQILSQSKDSTNGEVTELQSMNQMLSVIQNQLGDLTSTTAASSRLAATAAAEAQSQQDEEREIMKSFTDSPMLSTNSGHSYDANDF